MKRPFGLSPMLLTILCAVIIFGGFSYLYIYLIKPINAATAALNLQIQETQSQIQLKQMQLQQAKKVNINTLLTQLPTNENLDQYLLLINKEATNANIKVLSFGPSQNAPSSGSPLTTTGQTTSGSTANSTDTATSGTASTQAAASNTGSGIQSSTYQLTGSASSFSDLNHFIHTLESQNRITYVQGLSFTGTSSAISFSLTLQIFYDPSLKDLGTSKTALPYAKSAHKTSPF